MKQPDTPDAFLALQPAQVIVDAVRWAFDPDAAYASQSKGLLVGVLAAEGERRGWPAGWWEDPSVIPGLESGEGTREV